MSEKKKGRGRPKKPGIKRPKVSQYQYQLIREERQARVNGILSRWRTTP